MGRLGRFACIITPMLLTLLSLILIILIIAGGTKSSNEWINDVYFMRVRAHNHLPLARTSLINLSTDRYP